MAFFEYQPKNPVFYYTGFSGYEGIIQSKNLWMSDITASNDPRELSLGQQLLSEAMKGLTSEDVPGLDKQFLNGFLAEVFAFQRQSTCYACCFGLSGDELPLWREYADGGRGVSIGFRPTALNALPGRMQLVTYAEDDAIISDRFKSVAIRAALNCGRPRTMQRIEALIEAFTSITSVKHRSWAYEREARMIFNQRHQRPSPHETLTRIVAAHSDGSLVEWTEPLQRQSRGRDVAYMAFPYGRLSGETVDPSRAIATVRCGPKCEASPYEVEALLVSEGFQNFEVITSDCQVN